MSQRHRGRLSRSLSLGISLFLSCSTPTWAQTNSTVSDASELKKLSLEELMNLEVTTVARHSEPWFTSPSAIQVLTGEDIQRSGAASIPEALRLAPNLQAAQVDSRQWAISSRGFNNGLANKLLVMMDGRTVYTPLFAGVFWDVQDTLIDDLDRIEVISGPGATLWGANAVNGVINIITKPANETQGTLITGGGGSLLQDFGGARYGGKIGNDLYFRVYGKYFDRDDTVTPAGDDGTNSWRLGQGGFRMDYLPQSGDMVTFQGDGYAGNYEQAVGPGDLNGQNVIGRWIHPLPDDADMRLQIYWDRTFRSLPLSLSDELNTLDVDFQHHFSLTRWLALTWGAGYRLMADRTVTVTNSPPLPPAFTLVPPDRNLQLFSGFLQGEIDCIPDRLKLTVGTKLEHNDYTGLEVEPSGRLAWTPTERQTIWAAVSRAVRSPGRIDADLLFPNTPPYSIVPNRGFESETVIAFEFLGYRVRPIDPLTLSIAPFFNLYDNIRSLEPTGTNTFTIENGNRGTTVGVELSGTWQPFDWWRLRGGYTFLHTDVDIKPGSSDLNQGRAEGNDPGHQFVLQSMFSLPYHIDFDATFRYVSELPHPEVPGYFTFDLRLAWQPTRNVELSIVGQNLVDNHHPEFGMPATRQEIPRSVYGKVTLRF